MRPRQAPESTISVAPIQVANWTDKPVRVIGASRDCSCSVDDLPLSIPPKQTRPLSLTLRFSGQPGVFTRSAALLLDDDGFQQIAFRMTGRILPKEEESASASD